MSNLQGGGSASDFPTSDLAEPLKTPLTEPIPHATPLFILFFASIFELISASVMCSDIASLYGSCFGVVGYAVAVGAVSSALCIFMFICLANKSTSIHALHVAPMPTSCFLLLWWLVGWFTLTFNAPFTYVGNGYFASWLGVAAAAALCHAHTPQLASLYEKAVAWARGEPRQGIVAALAATSTVVWIEGAVALGGTEQACITAGGAAGQLVACGNGSVEAWAIAVGVVSTVVCLLAIFLKPQLAKFERELLAGLGAWWLQGVVISFIRDFFSATVNGYVALWGSVMLAGYLASAVLFAEPSMQAVPQEVVVD